MCIPFNILCSPLKEKFNSDGNESIDGGATDRRNEHDNNNNNKKSHLRRWMSKRFIERNAEYKSHREELRMKEKRPYKTLVIRERERERDLYSVCICTCIGVKEFPPQNLNPPSHIQSLYTLILCTMTPNNA